MLEINLQIFLTYVCNSNMNLSSLCSPLGLLKLVIIALLTCTMILSYIGNEGSRLLFGLCDYLGVGVTVGFALITPLLLLTYMANGNILVFVSIILTFSSTLSSNTRKSCSAFSAAYSFSSCLRLLTIPTPILSLVIQGGKLLLFCVF